MVDFRRPLVTYFMHHNHCNSMHCHNIPLYYCDSSQISLANAYIIVANILCNAHSYVSKMMQVFIISWIVWFRVCLFGGH